MRPFDPLRACFLLLALIVVCTMLALLATDGWCIWMVATGRAEMGACQKLGIAETMQTLWSETLTAVLALLAIGRGPPGPKS